MGASTADFKAEQRVEIDSLPFQVQGVAYTVFSYKEGTQPVGTFSTSLKSMLWDVDPSTGEADEGSYEDDYVLEDVYVNLSDYMQRTVPSSWTEEWDDMGDDNEAIERFAFTAMVTCKQAVAEIVSFLGMQPCDRSDNVSAKENKHILLLSGTWMPGIPTLARVRMRVKEGSGVLVELAVRSSDAGVSAFLSLVFL